MTLWRACGIIQIMSVYSHKREFELRYSDMDFQDKIKLSTLLSLAQEAACSSADELGFGYHHLKSYDIGFLVVNTYGEIYRPVRLGDRLTIETWPLPPRHVILERDYRVFNQDGALCAALASRWCLVDLKSFTLLKPDCLKEAHERCPYRAEKSVNADWRLPKTEKAGQERLRIRAANGDCDHYFHVNNAHYADLFLNCFTMDELSSRDIKSFCIAYHKQTKEGSEMVITRQEISERETLMELSCDGELHTSCTITF